MSRDYEALHIIQKQCDDNNITSPLKDYLQRAFNLICDNRVGDDCLSTTVALFVLCRMNGIDAKICYGLCETDRNRKYYHAWLEIDGKIIDLAIYGNLHFSPYQLEASCSNPVVMESYDYKPMHYGKFVFENDWSEAAIYAVDKDTIRDYIKNAPQDGMIERICKIMDKTPTATLKQEIYDAVGDTRFVDFKE